MKDVMPRDLGVGVTARPMHTYGGRGAARLKCTKEEGGRYRCSAQIVDLMLCCVVRSPV